jgi:WD40 repeat protein
LLSNDLTLIEGNAMIIIRRRRQIAVLLLIGAVSIAASLLSVYAKDEKVQPLWDYNLNAGPVYSLSYRPNSHELVCAHGDGGFRGGLTVVDSQKNERVFADVDKYYAMRSCALSSRDELAIGLSDVTLEVRGYDPKKWTRRFTLELDAGGYSADVSRDGKSVAIGQSDGRIILMDTQAKAMPTRLKGPEGVILSIRFDESGTKLVSGDTKGHLIVWHIKDRVIEKELVLKSKEQAAISCVLFGPGPNEVCAAYEKEGMIAIWNLETGNTKRTMQTSFTHVHAIAFAAEKRLVAAAFSNTSKGKQLLGGVVVWNVDTGRLIRSIECHTGGALSVAVSTDGKQLATGGRDSIVNVWDFGKLVGEKGM